jgi:hypothetical protein
VAVDARKSERSAATLDLPEELQVPGGAGGVTFSDHVAPILFRNCTPCHRPGQAAPFPLLSYEDARLRARLIAAVTQSRRMPPWKAAPTDYAFKNERRLTAAQIDTIRRWVAGGMPAGDRRRMPSLPAFTEGWALGPPDLVVTMREPFAVPASGPDIYRNFAVPLNLAEDTWVRAVEFRPSARSVVHHSLFFLDETGLARQLDDWDPLPGFGGAMGGALGTSQSGRAALTALLGGGSGATDSAPSRVRRTLGGWALGARPHALPKGLAFFVPRGADLILSTHFHPSGKPEVEVSTVGLYFAPARPSRSFTWLQIPPVFGLFEGIDIPPGERRYTISDSFVIPVDIEAFSVAGHAHYLARQMTLTATLPDGRLRTLLTIDDWDFSWQESYDFKAFVRLPARTRLNAMIQYDNSADNPRNPTIPPVRVRWGEQSTDEMGGLALQVLAVREQDLPRLREAYIAHVRQAAVTRPGLNQLLDRQSGGAMNRR